MQARRLSGQVAPVPAAREPPRITGVIIDAVERDPEPAPGQLQVITEEVPVDAAPAGYDSIWSTVMRSVSPNLGDVHARPVCEPSGPCSAAGRALSCLSSGERGVNIIHAAVYVMQAMALRGTAAILVPLHACWQQTSCRVNPLTRACECRQGW